MIKILEKDSGSEDGILNLIGSIFKPDGFLQNALNFEHREQQEKMALSVVNSLQNGSHLVFEAGTGVGKSLAYLIPSILFSKKRKRPCIVATNTINLQEQILNKDILTIRELFGQTPELIPFAEFRCALLVGRGNYLCSTRLSKALSAKTDLFETREKKELDRILEWSGSAKEGIRQELSPPPLQSVWESVNADSSVCSGKRCNPEHCYYRRARSLVEKADIIIVNHSLLFSLLGAGLSPQNDSDGIIFPDDFIIFDEAHEIPSEASEHLGVAISSWALENSLRRIYNPSKRKGLLKKIGRRRDLQDVEFAIHAVSDFFNHLHMAFLGSKDRLRILKPNEIPLDVLPPIGRVVRSLVELGENCEEESLKLELLDQSKRFQSIINGLSEVIEIKDSNSVYWMERTGKQKDIIHLRSAPLDVSQILESELFEKGSPVVMTSATLTQNKSAAKFIESIGCCDAEEIIVQSPFDYEFNMNIRVFEDCPEPMNQDRSNYLKYLLHSIDNLASSIEGGTLALFTNYQDLHFCYHQLKAKWQKRSRSLYAQGIDFSRSELQDRMLEETDVLLLGAESFWKGFDAKGPALSQVIITRLPFENPNHPIMEAKNDRLMKEGKNAFMELTLPSAILRFRQGIGRLIRSKNDIGELIILDSRILKKQYGKLFLSELPKDRFERENAVFEVDD